MKTNSISKLGQRHNAATSSGEGASFGSEPKDRVPGFSPHFNPDVFAWMRSAARFGHIGIGSVYIVVGVIAFGATLDVGVKAVGFQGALRYLLESYTGAALLVTIGFGLIADGVWQSLRAALNVDMADPGLRGYLERVSWVLGGLVHLGLGIIATKLAVGIGQRPGESQLRYWTESIMPLQFGGGLIGVAGIIIILVGIVFVRRAVRGDINRWLDLSSITRPVQVIVIVLGRFGIIARGAVFIVGGVLLVLAAVHVNPKEARGLGGTLRTIESQNYGHLLLACVALGFIAYGIFELICARYRRIRIPPDQTTGRLS